MTSRLALRRLVPLAIVAAVAAAHTAQADVIQQTDDPFQEGFGLFPYGLDVFVNQSVAIRFHTDAVYTLDQIGVWFSDNDSATTDVVTLTVRTDELTGDESRPSSTILETLTFQVPATQAFEFVFVTVDSEDHTRLEANTDYWLVAECPSPEIVDPVWYVALPGVGWSSTTDNTAAGWNPAFFGGSFPAHTILGTRIGPPPCRADFDGSGAPVQVADIFAFLSAWFAQGPRSDFDGNGETEVTDIFAFLSAWFVGC